MCHTELPAYPADACGNLRLAGGWWPGPDSEPVLWSLKRGSEPDVAPRPGGSGQRVQKLAFCLCCEEVQQGPLFLGHCQQVSLTSGLSSVSLRIRERPPTPAVCADRSLLSPPPYLLSRPLPSRPPMLLLPSPLSPTVSSKLKWPSPPTTAVPLRASVCPCLTPFSAGTAACLCPR